MRTWTLVALMYAGIGLAACAHVPAAPGTPQTHEQACDKPNEGQQISVEGYLRLPAALDSSNSVVLELYPHPDFTGQPIGVEMHFGDNANQVQPISSSYRDDMLKVRLADGRVVPFRTHVRVSGRMYFPARPQAYACALENPYVEQVK